MPIVLYSQTFDVRYLVLQCNCEILCVVKFKGDKIQTCSYTCSALKRFLAIAFFFVALDLGAFKMFPGFDQLGLYGASLFKKLQALLCMVLEQALQ